MLKSFIHEYGGRKKFSPFFYFTKNRPFSSNCKNKVLIISESGEISYSQIYPFLKYEKEFRKLYDAEFRIIASKLAKEKIPEYYKAANIFIVQTWLTDGPEAFDKIFENIKSLENSARVVYFDSFANSDIRLAENMDDIDLYYKKSLFRNREDFFGHNFFDTNLSVFYSELYKKKKVQNYWNVPRKIENKLRISPNFFTEPALLKKFSKHSCPFNFEDRSIDIHARLGGQHKPGWYGAMRKDALCRIENLKELKVANKGSVKKDQYFQELLNSKICFSPFGYGEICWRDFEAFSTGATLIKPDMSHLQTEPDIYLDGETYISIKWDFSDLEDKIAELMKDHDLRKKISITAWEKINKYIKDKRVIYAYRDIFNMD
jgi:hypothetical protein